MRRRHLTLTALTFAAALAAGCGSSSHNDADVAFAQQMVPHHEQAVTMSDLALEPGRGASAEVQALAEQIGSAQGTEIEQMNGWLEEWGEDADDQSGHGDHMDDEMGDDAGQQMEGMLSADELDELAGAVGTEFDTLWLTSMLAHHEGAVTMAEDVIADGEDPDVRELAEQIVQAQKDEIASMLALLG